MNKKTANDLSRRERQIMDILYRSGEISAAEVRKALPDPPGYSSVRTLLRILDEKGHVKHREKGLKYVYSPTVSQDKARVSALQHLITTFFNGSPEHVIAAILDNADSKLSPDELERMAKLIKKAKNEGK